MLLFDSDKFILHNYLVVLSTYAQFLNLLKNKAQELINLTYASQERFQRRQERRTAYNIAITKGNGFRVST